MAITKDEIRDLGGKRITIDGVRHRVERTVLKTGTIITREGIEIDAEGVYKRGPGFFYDSPKGKKKPAAATDAKPARQRKPKEEEPVKETARQRRLREKKEAADAAAGTSLETAPKGKTKTARKKKLFEAFEQSIAERISQEAFDLLTSAYADNGEYAITPVAVGASFDDNALKIIITVMPASKTAKEIKSYIRDHRESTDIASDDEEDDDLDDEELADDDEEDEDLEDNDSDDLEDDEDEEDAFRARLDLLTLKDLRKIAKQMEIDDYRGMDKDELVQELSEYEESDVTDAADAVNVALADGEEEENDDLEEEDEEDDSDDEEDESEDATVEDLVGELLDLAPDLKEKAVTKYVEAFLASDECTEKFDGELIPARTKLQEKGGKGPEMLLIGLDAGSDSIKLLNLTTLKTRSKTISEVVHMEVLEDADE